MKKYYISFNYGYGFCYINEDSAGCRSGTFDCQGISPEFKVMPPTDYVKKQYPLAKRNPLLVVESDKYLYEFLTGKRIRRIEFTAGDNSASAVIPTSYFDNMIQHDIIDVCQRRMLQYYKTNVVDELCVIDLHPVTVTEFSNLLKQINSSQIELDLMVTNIQTYFKNASIWGQRALAALAKRNQKKLDEENAAQTYIDKMSVHNKINTPKSQEDSSELGIVNRVKSVLIKKRKELLSTNANTPKNNTVPNNLVNDPLGEYIAKQKNNTVPNNVVSDPLGEYIARQEKQKRK